MSTTTEGRRAARGRRTGPQEIPSVRLALALHFLRRMGPPLALVGAYTLVAALIVQWDMARVGEAARPLGEELYGMYTQLFFEPTESLPAAPLARLFFWITPLVGVVLVAEGLVKVGSQLFDEDARRALWVRVMSERMIDHVVVCGLGHVGYRVVEALRSQGELVIAIERREDSFIEHVRAMKVPVIVGDARRDELLTEAGIERAKAVVCATNDDLANLEVALDAKRVNPNIRVVLRMFDQRLASKVGGALDLDETFSTSALAAPLVALQATQEGVRGVYALEGGLVRVAAELTLGPRARARTVESLEDELDLRVVGVRRPGSASVERPRSATEVRAGDTLVVDASVEALGALREQVG